MSKNENLMSKDFSVYLDLCRFCAALFVVLSHLTWYGGINSSMNYLLPESGRDAVIVFFVLSGLVISYTAQRKSGGIKEYFVDRGTRIYSVAFPLLLLTVVVDLIGIYFHPDNYTGLYQYAKLYIYIPLHLLFLGEIWTLSEQPFTIGPYWSLGYEVWYYILFATVFYFSGLKRIVLFSAVFMFVGYKLWLLFPIWLAGVVLLKVMRQCPLSERSSTALFFLSIFMYGLYKAVELDTYLINLGGEIWPFPMLPLGSASKYLSDYAVGIMFCLNLYGARYMAIQLPEFSRRTIVTVASYTFTLYLVHAPVMSTIRKNANLDFTSIYAGLFMLLVVAVLTYAIGELTEKRKHWFRPAINAIVNLGFYVINSRKKEK